MDIEDLQLETSEQQEVSLETFSNGERIPTAVS